MNIEDLENRFRFHPATTEEKKNAHASVRMNCLDIAKFINDKVPDGPEKEEAVKCLELAMFWANAAIARNKTEE